MTFRNRKITLMGLGLHGGGVAVARWLLGQGAILTITDLKSRRELASSIKMLRSAGVYPPQWVLGRHRASDFKAADLIIQNPGVPKESPYLKIARQHHIPITNEAKLFFQIVRAAGHCTVIGVTGTRGKSTTTALVAHILKQGPRPVFMGGNIRIPMFTILDPILRSLKQPLRPRAMPARLNSRSGGRGGSNPIVVLELSSWHCEHLDKTTGGPDVAVVTNILPDHLNRYRSMKDYAAAKERIVRFQNKDQVAVLNRNNPWTRKMAKHAGGRVVWFHKLSKDLVRSLQIPGAHNLENAAAAVQAVRSAGVYPPRTLSRLCRLGLRTFRGLPYRLELIRTIRGVKYVNDTTATTPDATIAALRALSSAVFARSDRGRTEVSLREIPRKGTISRRDRHGRSAPSRRQNSIILIAGGTDKNLHFHALVHESAKRVKALVLLPGTATDKLMHALQLLRVRRGGRRSPPTGDHQQGGNLKIVHAKSMQAALRAARRLASRGDTILLSPGAASFGLFKNEFDRGDQFNDCVKKL